MAENLIEMPDDDLEVLIEEASERRKSTNESFLMFFSQIKGNSLRKEALELAEIIGTSECQKARRQQQKKLFKA